VRKDEQYHWGALAIVIPNTEKRFTNFDDLIERGPAGNAEHQHEPLGSLEVLLSEEKKIAGRKEVRMVERSRPRREWIWHHQVS